MTTSAGILQWNINGATLTAATAMIWHPDGTATPIEAEDETAAARGTALVLARDTADSLDAIIVGPGAYTITSTLAKNGVDWFFFPGAVVTFSGASGYIFDTGGAVMTFTVGGSGTFISVPTLTDVVNYNSGIVRCNHASAVVNIDFDLAKLNLTGIGNDQGTYYAAFAGRAGRLNVRGRRLEVNFVNVTLLDWAFGLWWENGEINCNVQELVGTADANSAVTDLCLIASTTNATPTGHFRVNAQTIRFTGTDNSITHTSAPIDGFNIIWNSAGNANAATWVTAETVIGGNVVNSGTGKLYLTAQKVEAGRIWVGSGKFYLLGECKIGGDLRGDGDLPSTTSVPYLTVTGGTARIFASQFDPIGATGSAATKVAELVNVSGGTLYLHGGDMVGASAQDAVLVSGGTLNFFEGTVTASGGGKELHRTAGTLKVFPNVEYTAANTTGTITKANLYGVAQ